MTKAELIQRVAAIAVRPGGWKRAACRAGKGPPGGDLQKLRHLHAVFLEPFGEPAASQLVDQFERAELPVVAEAHGVIDAGDVIGNFRHQPGRVAQGARQHPPSVPPGLAGVLDERPEAALPRRRDAFQFRFFRLAVGAGPQVDRLLDLVRRVRLEAVKAALALSSRVALLDHAFDHFGLAEDLMEGIAFGQRLGHAAENVRHQVEPDHVEKPEDAGLGDAGGAAHDRVRLFDGQAFVHGVDDAALKPINADAVGDEARRVLAENDRLAEPVIAEPADYLQGFGPRAFARHHLQKPEITGRIEKMGNQEVGLETFRHAFGQNA